MGTKMEAKTIWGYRGAVCALLYYREVIHTNHYNVDKVCYSVCAVGFFVLLLYFSHPIGHSSLTKYTRFPAGVFGTIRVPDMARAHHWIASENCG